MSKGSEVSDLNTFPNRKVQTPSMNQIVLQLQGNILKTVIFDSLKERRIDRDFGSFTYLNHMPHTAPSLAGENRSHNLNKSDFGFNSKTDNNIHLPCKSILISSFILI